MTASPPRTPRLSFDLRELAPELERRTTVRLHPRLGPEVAADQSKIGGAIAWPASEPWPVCREHQSPYVAVLQLTRRDVPELGFPGATQLFQLLWCPHDHDEPGVAPVSIAAWREAAPEPWLTPPPPAETAVQTYLPRACRLFPERVDELPSPHDLPLGRSEELDEQIALHARSDLQALGIPADHPLYQYHFSAAPGVKVGGHPRWVQFPERPTCACGNVMTYLLTIASVEFDGAYQRWMPLEERDTWKHPSARFEVQSAPNLMIGDMGDYYVFACRSCPGAPIATVMQCS